MTELLWCEKYRPKRVDDCVLPDEIKSTLLGMRDRREVPNLLLAGPPGVGKTTAARALLDELGHDVYFLNGSLSGNIDTLRNEILDFASTVSFTGARKTVLIDEADYLNPQSFQPALRNFMEEYSSLTGFVLTCNYPSRIIEPLHSRCSVVEFRVPRSEKPKLMGEFFLRVRDVLEREGVEHDPKVVGTIIAKRFPDFRRVLNELQKHASRGPIDSRALALEDSSMDALVHHMREKDFTSARKWLGESDVDPTTFFRRFYDRASSLFTDDSVPQLVLLIADYQYKSSHVADQEVNCAAFVAHVMATCSWRDA